MADMDMDADLTASPNDNNTSESLSPTTADMSWNKETMDPLDCMYYFQKAFPDFVAVDFDEQHGVPYNPTGSSTLAGPAPQEHTEMSFGERYQQGGEAAFGAEPDEEDDVRRVDDEAVTEPASAFFNEAISDLRSVLGEAGTPSSRTLEAEGPLFRPHLAAAATASASASAAVAAPAPAPSRHTHRVRGVSCDQVVLRHAQRVKAHLRAEQLSLAAFGRSMLSRQCPKCSSKHQTSIQALAMYILPPEITTDNFNHTYFDARVPCAVCSANVCLGCNQVQPVPQPPDIYQESRKLHFSYHCCEEGRLVVLWLLLCVNGLTISEPVAVVYFQALAKALPCSAIRSRFDINPPAIVRAMIRRSLLLDRLFESLIKMDRLKLCDWRAMHWAIAQVVQALNYHPLTKFLFCGKRLSFLRGLFIATFPTLISADSAADTPCVNEHQVIGSAAPIVNRIREKMEAQRPELPRLQSMAYEQWRQQVRRE
ncbi:Fc.00g074160.m01.CDS01 [Cosmosporella sp. VM-42]